MSEYRTQRNVLLIVIAATCAIGVGILIGRNGGMENRPPTDSVAAPASASPTAPGAAMSPPSTPISPARVEPRSVSASRPARPVIVTVPAGTKIELELAQGLSSQTSGVGDAVVAEVSETIWVDGRAAIPAGSRAEGSVTEARPLRKIGGRGLLAVTFDEIQVPGDEAPITASWRQEGKSETAKDAATIAAGAAVGTVVGNQAKKNDQGKVIGGILGAGIGTLIATRTEGQPVELPAGSRITLTLRDPVEVRLKS